MFVGALVRGAYVYARYSLVVLLFAKALTPVPAGGARGNV